MARVLFTRPAVNALRRLSEEALSSVLRITGRLNPDSMPREWQLISGGFHAFENGIQVLGRHEPGGDPVVVWAGPGEPPESPFPPGAPDSWPAFEWAGRTIRHLTAFTQGGYRLAPRLTTGQSAALEPFLRSVKVPRRQEVLVLEGEPGSGKTTAALLTACRARTARPDLHVDYVVAGDEPLHSFREMVPVRRAFGDRAHQAVSSFTEWLTRLTGANGTSADDMARTVIDAPPPPAAGATLLVVDGAQVLTAVQIEAVFAVWRALHAHDAEATLWLILGPEAGEWSIPAGVLGDALLERHFLEGNHRNAPAIQRLMARILHGHPLLPEDDNARHVALMALEDPARITRFLALLHARYTGPEYFRSRLPVLPVLLRTGTTPVLPTDLPMYFPDTVAGHEFDSAAVLVTGDFPPPAPGPHPWYQLISRVRDKLLLLVRLPDVMRLEGYPLFAEEHRAIDWLQECDDLFDLASGPEAALDLLSDVETWPDGLPFRDTWQILAWFRIPPQAWEERTWTALRKLEPAALAALTAPEQHPWMQELGYRLLAEHLQEAGRPYEAARLRTQKLGEPWPSHLPLPDIGTANGDLITLLCGHISHTLSVKKSARDD